MKVDEDYDLDVLLELRQKERDEAEKHYAQALKRHDELEKEVQRLRGEHQRLIEQRKSELQEFDENLASGPQTMARIQEFDRYVAGLKAGEQKALQRVEDGKKEKRRAQRELQQANDAMLAAIRQLKAVEKHYENWQDDKALTEKRRQSAQMDDIAARMWREGK